MVRSYRTTNNLKSDLLMHRFMESSVECLKVESRSKSAMLVSIVVLIAFQEDAIAANLKCI